MSIQQTFADVGVNKLLYFKSVESLSFYLKKNVLQRNIVFKASWCRAASATVPHAQ